MGLGKMKSEERILVLRLLLFGLIFLVQSYAGARVFVFEDESFAPYIQLRTGVSSMGEDPYRWQGATQYGGDSVDLMYGGEFGFYMRGSGFGLALGVLVHTFDPVTGGRGLNAAGTQLYSVDLEGLAFGPQIVFDYQFSSAESYVWKLLLGGGYQFAKIESTYSYTAAGQALNGGQASLAESYKQESMFALVGVSTEFMMSGTTTLSVTAGYHYNLNQEWNYGQGGQNFAGTHNQGASVVFEDGSAREIDWSYPFIQLGFHFYVDTLR
jgi:hypothetical protein